MEHLIALVALTAMEIVLGIDNIVFIAILSRAASAGTAGPRRRLGLLAALVTRVLLLMTLKWVLGLTQPLFAIASLGIPESWLPIEVN